MDCGSEIWNPNRTASFLANSRQSFIEEGLQLAPDSNADMFRRKILLQRKRLWVFAIFGRDA
jgi:hypothetical protein